MYGVCTRNAEDATWPDFDRAVYEVKSVAGRHADPIPEAVSAVACFADTATAETTPELAARDAEGRPATPDHPELETGHVCPTDEHYREGVLETVADAASVSGDVRLDEVGQPAGFCRCDRCVAAAGDADWTAWRADSLTDFVAAAAERVPGSLSLSVEPDPYPDHLRERHGLDVDALTPHVDEFVVPLYDPAYETTYWLESIASGFADRLDRPLGVELLAAGVDVDALVEAVRTVDPYADAVYLGFEAGTARAAIRRLKAERRAGETHGRERSG